MNMKHALIAAVIFLAGFGTPEWAQTADKVVLKSIDLPGNYKEDGFWAGMLAGSDGKVYIGTNTEGGGYAQFYIYDPATGKIRHRATMAQFLGEYANGGRSHAKIHTKFVEDSAGNIYFATGNMGAGPAEVNPMTWKGGHWCRYNPKTDELKDLGLVLPYQGVYGLAIDKKRNLLFGATRENHLVIYNIATGETTDKGRICIFPSSVPRTIVADDEGHVYATFHPDRMAKYDAQTGRFLDIPLLRLPSDPAMYPATTSIFKNYMRAGFWDTLSRKMIGVEACSSFLFEYDPAVGEGGKIQVLDRLLPPQDSEEVRKAHYASLSLTLGPNREIYYMPFGSMPPNEAEKANRGIPFFDWAGQAYFITYDLQTGEKRTLGRIYTEDGARVIDFLNRAPSGGATTAPDGTMYFGAFVEEKNPEWVSTRFGNIPARLRLLICRAE